MASSKLRDRLIRSNLHGALRGLEIADVIETVSGARPAEAQRLIRTIRTGNPVAVGHALMGLLMRELRGQAAVEADAELADGQISADSVSELLGDN